MKQIFLLTEPTTQNTSGPTSCHSFFSRTTKDKLLFYSGILYRVKWIEKKRQSTWLQEMNDDGDPAKGLS